MSIITQCSKCGEDLQVADEFAGMHGQCPTCGNMVLFAAPPPSMTTPPPDTYTATTPPPAPPRLQEPGAAAPPGAPAYEDDEGPAPLSMERQRDVMTITAMGAGIVFLLLLALSTFLRWAWWGALPRPGASFGDVRMILCAALVLATVIGLGFRFQRWIGVIVVVAAAFGTFTFVMLLTFVRDAGAGVILGLLGALGVSGTCSMAAAMRPLEVELPILASQPPFVRTHAPLLAAHAVALVLGVLYVIFAVI
jgi:hypothetical protein